MKTIRITYNDGTDLITKASGTTQEILADYQQLNVRIKNSKAKVKSITFSEYFGQFTFSLVA